MEGVFRGNNGAVLFGFVGSLGAKRSAKSGLLSCIDPVPNPVVGFRVCGFRRGCQSARRGGGEIVPIANGAWRNRGAVRVDTSAARWLFG
jgi:hypothetical protein